MQKSPISWPTYLMAEGTDCLPGWFPKNVCSREAAVLRRKGERTTRRTTRRIARSSLRMLPLSAEGWVGEELLVIRGDVWAEAAGEWGPKASAVVHPASLRGADLEAVVCPHHKEKVFCVCQCMC